MGEDFHDEYGFPITAAEYLRRERQAGRSKPKPKGAANDNAEKRKTGTED